MSALTPPLPQRPTSVVFASYFTAINAAAFVLRLVVRYAQPPPRPLWAEFFGVAAFTALGVLWVYGLWRRRNWVRWITIAYGVGNILAVPRAPALFHGPALFTFWVEVASGATAAVLLLLPSARSWYTSQFASRPNQLSAVSIGYRILGSFGVICGGAALTTWFSRGPQGSGAYTTGYSAGVIFWALLFLVGGCYLLSRSTKNP
jgi:hypothetical protein